MERSRWVGSHITYTILIFLGSLAAQRAAYSEVVFAPPAVAPRPEAEEQFPEAHFGPSKIQPEIGVGPNYVWRAVSDMDEEESPRQGAKSGERSQWNNRRPAGLEFTTDTGPIASSDSYPQPAPQPAPPPPPQPQSQPPTPTSGSSDPIPAPAPAASVSSNGGGSGKSELVPYTPRGGIQEVALIVGDSNFFPSVIVATRDIRVRMFVTSSSKKTLCIMMDAFQIRKQVQFQKVEELVFTPTRAGKFRFYCPVNGIEGTLLVKDLGSPLQSPDTGEAVASSSSKDEVPGG